MPICVIKRWSLTRSWRRRLFLEEMSSSCIGKKTAYGSSVSGRSVACPAMSLGRAGCPSRAACLWHRRLRKGLAVLAVIRMTPVRLLLGESMVGVWAPQVCLHTMPMSWHHQDGPDEVYKVSKLFTVQSHGCKRKTEEECDFCMISIFLKCCFSKEWVTQPKDHEKFEKVLTCSQNLFSEFLYPILCIDSCLGGLFLAISYQAT